jgi:nicotinamidase-related amidase
MQKGFDEPYWGTRNNPDLESNCARLLEAFRQAGQTVIHVRHDSVEADSPLRPDRPGNAFKDEVVPFIGEHLETKSVNSAFIGTGLETFLRANGLKTIVLCGLTSDHCVSTTTRMAANLGFDAIVAGDGVATFDRTAVDGRVFPAQMVHDVSLASLNGEFARVLSTGEILALLPAFAVSLTQ